MEENLSTWENSETGKFLQDFILGINLGNSFEVKMKKELTAHIRGLMIPQSLSQNENGSLFLLSFFLKRIIIYLIIFFYSQ